MAAATYATYAHGWWGTWGVGGQGPESTRIDPRCKELAHSDTGTGRGGGERGWCFQILFYDTCIGTCTQQSWWNRWNQFFFLISPKEIRIEQLKFEDTLSILQDAGTNVWLDHVGSFQEHPGVRDLARTSEASEFLVTVVQRLSLFFLGGCHINWLQP